jgi:hypothetical protein
MSNQSISTEEAIKWITAVKLENERIGFFPQIIESTRVGIMALRDEEIVSDMTKEDIIRWLTSVRTNYEHRGLLPQVVESLNMAISELGGRL